MMPLTLASVGHVASLDIYSGNLVLIDSINHTSSYDNIPLWNGGDRWSQTWTRTYAVKLHFPDDEFGAYIQPSRGPSHIFYMKDVTGLPIIACFSSNLREFNIIGDTGSITTWDSTLGPPNAFGLVQLEVGSNSIRKLIIQNAPCLHTMVAYYNQLTELDLSNIGIDWQVIDVTYNALQTLNVTSSGAKNASLNCGFNQLTSLTFASSGPGPWNPYQLLCNDNNLTSLDLSVPTKMYDLICSNNPLGTLDVHYLENLYTLTCINCSLTTLDITNTVLGNIDCRDNLLDQTNIDNIYINLNTTGQPAGRAILTGVSMAAPSVAGIFARGALVTKGWTISDVTGEYP